MTQAIAPRYALDFDAAGWRWQVIELPATNRIQLWFAPAGETVWQLGHGKDVPAHMTVQGAMQLVRMYVRGDISLDEYNAALPR